MWEDGFCGVGRREGFCGVGGKCAFVWWGERGHLLGGGTKVIMRLDKMGFCRVGERIPCWVGERSLL